MWKSYGPLVKIQHFLGTSGAVPRRCGLPVQVLETEEARELVKAYALLVGQLADFEEEKIQVRV